MSQIKIIKGNIFNSSAQTLVNTVNTVGVMGSGIALEFRLRYPEMYNKYVDYCKQKQMQIGKLWIYKAKDRWILNFPTKENWKDDSKIEYLEKGLQKFVDTYKIKGITSVAFPILGANLGKIPKEQALEIMQAYLSKCNIPIEIYEYDSETPDDLFAKLKSKFSNMSIEEISKKTNIQKQYVKKLLKIFNDESIQSISKLNSVEGIGVKTLEKLFNYFFDRVTPIEHDKNKEELIKIASTNLKPESLFVLKKYISRQKKVNNSLFKVMKAIIENKA